MIAHLFPLVKNGITCFGPEISMAISSILFFYHYILPFIVCLYKFKRNSLNDFERMNII